jgi:hypothetical protein
MTTLASELLGKRLDLLLRMVPRARKVGFLSGTSNFADVEGQNVTVEYHWPEGQYDRLPVLMALTRSHQCPAGGLARAPELGRECAK